MTAPLDQYLRLSADLANLRRTHAGAESPEEDALLEKMDEVWENLSEADIAELNRQPAPSRHPSESSEDQG
jgi:tRNA U55 pseudouridine synthase TruB